MKIVAISGGTRRPSKTTAVVNALATIAAPPEARVDLFDLLDVGLDFGAAVSRAELGGAARRVVTEIEDADALIVGSPVYKGAYSGLFKHLFDLVEPDALLGKPVCIAATGGGHRHALVVEQFLRPLFGFFGAMTVPTAIYAADSDFLAYELTDQSVLRRLERAAGELRTLLHTPVRNYDINYAS